MLFFRRIFTLLGGRRFALWRAACCYRRAVNLANSLFQATGRRYYVVWSPDLKDLIPITYQAVPHRTDSYQYLRRRGILPPLSVKQLSTGSFYFTGKRKDPSASMPEQECQRRMELLYRRYFFA